MDIQSLKVTTTDRFRVNHNDFWKQISKQTQWGLLQQSGKHRLAASKAGSPEDWGASRWTKRWSDRDLLTAKIGGSDRPSSPIKYPLQYNPI